MLKCHGGRCSWERLQRNGYFWCYFLSSSSEIGLYCAYFSSEGLKGTGKYYVSPRFFQEKRFPLLLLPQQSLPCATGVAAAEIQPSRHRGNAGFVHGHWHRWGWVKSTEICWGFMLKALQGQIPIAGMAQRGSKRICAFCCHTDGDMIHLKSNYSKLSFIHFMASRVSYKLEGNNIRKKT